MKKKPVMGLQGSWTETELAGRGHMLSNQTSGYSGFWEEWANPFKEKLKMRDDFQPDKWLPYKTNTEKHMAAYLQFSSVPCHDIHVSDTNGAVIHVKQSV